MAEAQQQQNRKLLLAYAEASRDLATPLARALEAAAFDVVHSSSQHGPDDAALESARTVLVCWTPAAVAIDAVTLQAARARKAGKLASVLLAPCTPPASLGGQYLLGDLSSWRGDATDREFVQLVHAIHARQSRRLFSSAPQWAARYMSWGSLGAVALGSIAVVANFGDVRQTIDGVFNPSASEAALSATDAKVEEVLTLLKQKSPKPLSADAEAALRDSIERLLNAQSGARGAAASKLEKGDFQGALGDLDAAAQEGEKAANGLAETWMEIGALHYPSDTYASLNAYLRATELAPHDVVARSQLGNLYLRTGQLDKAQEAFDLIRTESDDDTSTSVAYGSLGVIAMTRGDFDTAKENFTLSLEMNQKNGDIAGQAADLGDLGEIARINSNYPEAEKRIAKSRDLYVQLADREGEALATARLGAIARDRKRYDDAERLFRASLAIAEEIDDAQGQAFAHSGLGDVALDRKQLDEAKKHYEASYHAADSISAQESLAVAFMGLGSVAELQGDRTTAIERFRDAKLAYQDMGLKDEVDRLSERLKALGATPSPEGAEK